MKLRLLSCCLCVFFVGITVPAMAAVFTVTNSNDFGVGSLRQAVADANATAAADTIQFNTAGHFSTARTIFLSGGRIEITRPLTINGPTAAGQRVTLSGNGLTDTLSVVDSVGNAVGTVTLRQLTVSNTLNGGSNGIYVNGSNTTLNLEDCTVTECGGLGMWMVGDATANITNCIFSNCVGGISINSGSRATLDGCTVSNNDLPLNVNGVTRGGGIQVSGSELTATDTVIAFNDAEVGGGIFVGDDTYSGSMSAKVSLTRCVLSANNASVAGGGMYLAGDGTETYTLMDTSFSANTSVDGAGCAVKGRTVLVAQSSTLSHNIADNWYPNNEGGGGMHLEDDVVVTLVNCTIAHNSSNVEGAGIVTHDNAQLTATNCTIAGNTALTSNAPQIPFSAGAGVQAHSRQAATIGNCIISGNTGLEELAWDIEGSSDAPINSAGNNLIGAEGPASSNFTNGGAAHDQIGTRTTPLDPKLGPLQGNGGETLTRALLFGSPAIEAGKNALVTDPPFNGPAFKDQRGQTRIVGGRVDIGAFEFPALEVTHTGDSFSGSLRDMIGQANGLGGGVIGFRESTFGGSRQTITLSTGQIAITTPISIVAPDVGVTISGNNNSRIFNITAGDVTVERVHFLDGNSTAEGGAVRVAGATTTLLMKSCSATSCDAIGGGALVVENGTAQITDSYFKSNSATTGGGGALKVTTNGTLRLTNSTVASNSSTSHGGGLLNDSGTTTLVNTTFTANTADSDNNNSGNGGGLFRTAGTVNLGNTIVAGNSDLSSTTSHPDYSGTFTTLGHNCIGITLGGAGLVSGSNGDLTGNVGSPLNPLLSSLGGGTYYVPQATSPATDAGDNELLERNAWPAVPERDQRGQQRIINSTVDIGAVEGPINAVVTLSVADDRGSERGGDTAKFRLRRSLPTGSLAVTLNLEASSSASAADYTLSGPSYQVVGGGFGVAFPDGDDTITVTVTPVDDAATEGLETLIVSLTGIGYSLDPTGGNTQSVEILSDEYLITSNASSGAGSLRNAINECNDGGGGKITLAGPMNITLGGTPLLIDSEIEIIGNISTISAAGRSRVFEITGDGGGCVKLQGLIITGGETDGDGGGVFIDHACVEIRGCGITQNHAGQWGGGIYDDSNGPALLVVNSAIYDNTAANGGGIALLHDAQLTNVTIARNTANDFSGGLHFSKVSATATLTNCTVTANTANSDGNALGNGGGIYTPLGTVTLRNSVVAMNTSINGTFTPDLSAAGGVMTSGGGNFIGVVPTVTTVASSFPQGSPNVNGDYTGNSAAPLNPNLSAQQDLRPFYAFPPTSLLSNHGINASNTEPNDQRGKPRIVGTIDIGAVEMSGFVVTTLNDAGLGSLRRAINDANTAGGGDIVFDPSVFGQQYTITLTSGELVITSPVDVMAPSLPGIFGVSLSPSTSGRILKIAPAAATSVTLRNIAFNGGNTAANAVGDRQGGVMLVAANANVTLRHCLLNSGVSTTDGGLAMVSANASLLATDTTFSGGYANRGGNIYNNGSLNLERCTLYLGNSSTHGGGIYNVKSGSLINCSLVSNDAFGAGGGIFNAGSAADTLSLLHCTLTANRCNTDLTGAEPGGGIRQFSGIVSLRNTLLANNREGNLPTSPKVDTAGVFVSAGYNLIASSGTATGITNGINGDQVGTDAGALNEITSGLRDNGGSTWTNALFCNSLSIDTGDETGAPATDQRGLLRRSGDGVDIGAYELQPETYSFWADHTIGNGSNSGETDDRDGDGVSNAVEYGAGTDPLSAASRPIIGVTVAPLVCHFDFPASSLAPPGYLRRRLSTNLSTWADAPAATFFTCNPLTGQEIWRVTVVYPGNPKRFARLER